MAMEIYSAYSSYTGSFINPLNSQTQTTTQTAAAKGTAETGSENRNTAAEELSYLSNKFSGYTFVSGIYQQGTAFGSADTTNVMIDPRFLTKMAADPQLEKEYEGYIADLQRLDKEFAAQQAAMGWRVEQGWVIDKDGGISGWVIGHKDPNAKSYLQKTSETVQEIREKNDEKIKAQEEITEKRQAASEENAKLKETMKAAAGEAGSAGQKTAAEELSYLSSKYSNYRFFAANYSKGMRYGSSSTINVAISPQFLAKMAGDPELEKEYEKNIAAMQECDEQNARSVAAGGWHVVNQGWAIDKDGGISKWSIVEKDKTKSYLQRISEEIEKIKASREGNKENAAVSGWYLNRKV